MSVQRTIRGFIIYLIYLIRKMNKQDLINEIRECRFGVNESITDIDELWVWINQNYISKEEIKKYDELALKHYGNNARLNFKLGGQH